MKAEIILAGREGGVTTMVFPSGGGAGVGRALMDERKEFGWYSLTFQRYMRRVELSSGCCRCRSEEVISNGAHLQACLWDWRRMKSIFMPYGGADLDRIEESVRKRREGAHAVR